MAGPGGCTGGMELVILLDTNVISAVMQSQPDPAVVCWLDDRPSQDVWLPSGQPQHRPLQRHPHRADQSLRRLSILNPPNVRN